MRRLLLILTLALLIPSLAQAQDAADPTADCDVRADGPGRLCRDIHYVPDGDERQRIDLFLPDGDAAPQTLVILLHGGGFATGDRSTQDVRDMADLMLFHGYAVAAVGYRLRPEHEFPAQVEDAICAWSWLAQHGSVYGVEADAVIALGFSAGGLLSSLLSTPGIWDGAPPACMPADSADVPVLRGAISLNAPADITEAGFANRRYMIPTDADADLLARYSPLYSVDPDNAPLLLIHGGADAVVPADESRQLAAALEAVGAPVRLVVVPDAGHALQDWPEADRWMALSEILLFIDALVAPPRADV